MTESTAFLCHARLDGRAFVFLWDGEAPKSVLIDDVGAIRAFSSEAAARQEAVLLVGKVATDSSRYDFDEIRAWCASENTSVDCSAVLDIWNVLTDIPREKSLFDEADARAGTIYDKLVFGCNIPAISVPGETFVPIWSPRAPIS
jgi:hypothetical protein